MNETKIKDNSQGLEIEEGIRLSKEEINDLPLGHYKGEIELIADSVSLSAAIETLQQEPILGFDTETRPAFKKGQSYLPALLQLASSDRVYIFQLKQLPHFGGLARLLSDSSVMKCGVSIKFDIQELQKVFEFEAAGFKELSTYASKKGYAANGLRGLAAALLGFRISKGAKTTNWERNDLSAAQVRYAATDAWVSREIYLALQDL